MEFTFLGTSAGTPTLTRNVTGLALKMSPGKAWYLVDCGEGTQHQLLKSGWSLVHLRAIFITHVHGDHCFGLPGIIGSAAMAGKIDPLTVYGPPELQEYIEVAQRITDMHVPFELNFKSVYELEQGEKVDELEVTAIPLSHRVPSWAWSFKHKEERRALNTEKLAKEGITRGPLWGQLQQGEDIKYREKIYRASDFSSLSSYTRKLIVGGDNDSPELLLEQASTADVLVHEATYTQEVADRVGNAPQHSSAKQVAEMANRAGLHNLVLTHFSSRYRDHDGDYVIRDIEDEARAFYKGNLFLARDLDGFYLDDRGLLRYRQADNI